MENSAIEWTDHTWNPWIGCTKVDTLCKNCYAEARDIRFNGGEHWGPGKPRQRTTPGNWREPYHWNRATPGARVFCASLADWLDEEIPVAWLLDMLKVVHDCQSLVWLLLTKRPEQWAPRIEAVLKAIEASDDWDADPAHPLCSLRNWLADWVLLRKPPGNVWIGTSVGDQTSADKRLPEVLQIPAVKRFLSCEPMLGHVDLTRYVPGQQSALSSGKIHWVICGGESGLKARPMHPGWARSLRDQAVGAGIPYLFKQWGEWAPLFDATASPEHIFPDGEKVFRVGKKAAGRMLDGRQWDEVPNG